MLFRSSLVSFVPEVLEGMDPSECALRRERDAAIYEVLRRLPRRERRCVELHYLGGKTHRQIAKSLHVPQDTVSTIIRRSRKELKAKFIKKGLWGVENS